MSIKWENVAVSIRTVPSKRDASALLERVRRFAPHAGLSPHAPGRSVAESYADAIAYRGACESPLWVLQFEDDAILAPDFEVHALPMIRAAHADKRVGMVSFYSGRRIKSGEALPPPGTWETLPGAKFLMAQAIAFPVHLVEDHNAFMLEFTRSNERPYATDPGTAAWLKARGLRYLRAWPAIVQHDEVKSLYGHNMNPNRYSESYRRAYG